MRHKSSEEPVNKGFDKEMVKKMFPKQKATLEYPSEQHTAVSTEESYLTFEEVKVTSYKDALEIALKVLHEME